MASGVVVLTDEKSSATVSTREALIIELLALEKRLAHQSSLVDGDVDSLSQTAIRWDSVTMSPGTRYNI